MAGKYLHRVNTTQAILKNGSVALVGKSTMKPTDNLNKDNRHLQPFNHLADISAKFWNLGGRAGVTFQQ